MAPQDRILKYFQRYFLVIYALVAHVAVQEKALQRHEVRPRYEGEPPCGLPFHEHT